MFKREYMVKQYVGKLKNSYGGYLQVFTTGDPKYYLFVPMDSTGQFTGTIHWPVLKANLNRGWKRHMVA